MKVWLHVCARAGIISVPRATAEIGVHQTTKHTNLLGSKSHRGWKNRMVHLEWSKEKLSSLTLILNSLYMIKGEFGNLVNFLHVNCKKNRINAIVAMQHFLESKYYMEDLVLTLKGNTPYKCLYTHSQGSGWIIIHAGIYKMCRSGT